MRTNLVVVRCGPHSLHETWFNDDVERNWDLLLCPYAEVRAHSDFTVPPIVSGLKWSGLHALLTRDQRWRAYDYIWLPDDDLTISGSELNRFFDCCHRSGARLAAPSLSERSFFTYPLTMHNRAFQARATNFVEIMAPCFRRDVLADLLPTFAESSTGCGWGLDFAWANLLGQRGLYIFDCVQMHHDRPVGAARSGPEDREAREDFRRVLAKFGGRFAPQMLHPCGEDGRPLEVASDRALQDYLRGYDYLAAADPGILDRVASDQARASKPRRRGSAARFRSGVWRLLH